MKIEEIAKQLANKVNQEHYVMHYLEKIQRGAYEKGVKDTQANQLTTPAVVSCLSCGKKHAEICGGCVSDIAQGTAEQASRK